MSDCLQDVLISELPRIDQFSYDDLLVLDVKKTGREVFETHAITWGHLSGIYPPGSGSGGGGGNGGGFKLFSAVLFLSTKSILLPLLLSSIIISPFFSLPLF